MLNYTIIIPHKNCPDLLERCVCSIPEREDVQVIVVDDNSDADKKPQLSRKDVEVILLDAEHSKGAGRARNVGLQHAKGKWLLFADADDFYTDFISKILDKYACDEATEIVYLNALTFNENSIEKPFKTNGLIMHYLRKEKGAELKLKYDVWTPWSRMVKRNIVQSNNLRFDELPACNDKMFCLFCSYYTKVMTAEQEFVYNYYKPSQGSQTDRQRNKEMLDGLLDVRCRTIALYKSVGYKPIPSIAELLFNSIYSKGLSIYSVCHKYRVNLLKTHVSLLVDLYRFIRLKLKKL